MAYPSKHSDPLFHLQGGALLGAIVGLIVSGLAPRPLALAVMAAAGLAFALWFRGSLWPLLTKQRFYESFFGIPGPGPVTYIREGMAAGVVVGGAVRLVLSAPIASLLVWAGLALLLFRYRGSLGCLMAALRGEGSGPAYGRLLTRLQGDRALAERLIAYESRAGSPGSREELAERALERLERDSR